MSAFLPEQWRELEERMREIAAESFVKGRKIERDMTARPLRGGSIPGLADMTRGSDG